MTDLIYLYCGFMYLFHIGMIIEAYPTSDHKIGALISMIFAPVTIPVMFGIRFGEG